jgi:hypothetical protein
MSTDSDLARHYPDAVALGSLAAAIEAAAARRRRPLGAVRPSDGAPLTTALVASTTESRRELAVTAARTERRFRIEGWGLGIWLVVGDTDDLDEVVEAAHLWRAGEPLHDIRRSVPFVRLTARGEVAEQGPEQVVTAEWQRLRQSAAQADRPNHQALVESAYREPSLRRLYPYTSHEVLNFSTTTGYPFPPSPVSLTAFVDDASYRVWKRGGVMIGDTATAEEAVALAVAHLPADLGPAASGTYTDPT